MIEITNIINNLKNEIQNEKLNFLDFNHINLELIEHYINEIKSNFNTLLIVGTGASVLNAKALIATINTTAFNIRFLDNLDYATISANINDLNQNNTAILVISKSGNTHETLTLLSYISPKLVSSSNLYMITEDKNSKLTETGQKLHGKLIPHPKDIGGRFAILTIVGLLPAGIAGVNIRELLNQAKIALKSFLTDDTYIFNYIKWVMDNFAEGRHNMLTFYYADQLIGLYEWVRQMYAESLGKSGFGITPIISRGTIDQHSQLQLYLDGPNDKFYNVIYLNNLANIPKESHYLNKTFALHAKSIYVALQEYARPVKFIESKDSYAHVATEIVNTIISIIIIAKIRNINPFDQPAVESYKKYIIDKK